MKKGTCHICRKKSDLTFEHIPPEKAFNSSSIKLITGDELLKTIGDDSREPWDYTDLKYKQQQRGMGLYSLCSSCNNITGKWYGQEYIRFVYTIRKLVFENELYNKKITGIEMKQVHVSRIGKQILSMFCSVYPGLTATYPFVKDLILNRDAVLKDFSKFRITMFLLKEYRMGYMGITGMLCGNGKLKMIAEIDAYPLGFVLELEPKDETEDVDITNFLSHTYEEKFDIKFGVNIRERNIIFPTDYRTKEEIIIDTEKIEWIKKG